MRRGTGFVAHLVAVVAVGLLLGSVAVGQEAAEQAIALFNGRDLGGLYPVIGGQEKGQDPNGVFRVEDGMIRIAGKPNGYLVTEKEYENYRARIEYKWLEAEGVNRNSGLLVHVQAPDRVWPKSIECQLMHGNEGDYWLIGNTSLTVDGETHTGGHVPNKAKGTKPVGEWNVVEVICQGDTVTNIVNGVEVNRGTAASLTKGKILVQSEGAPMLVRKWELYPLGDGE